MTTRVTAAVLLSCVGLAACASPATNSGANRALADTVAATPATSSNGGGQRNLGSTPNIGTNTATGSTVTPVLNSKGASY